jgi:hypothetical protein
MKPRNKQQEFMVEWSKGHSALTKAQTKYAHKHCFGDVILTSHMGCLCTRCKTTWHTHEELKGKATCPSCRKKLTVVEHKAKISMAAYFTVFTTVNNMQAVKWYLVSRDVDKNQDSVSAIHVGTEFLTQDGKRWSVELPRFTMCWQKDKWRWDAPQELRRLSVFKRYFTASASYYVNVLPILKRNGYKCSREYENYDTDVMEQLLSNPNFESWVKVGHVGVVKDWLSQIYYDYGGRLHKPSFSDAQLTMIKLANRKHILFDTKEKWADYKDYLKDLEYMGKDIHNPSILFPQDFQKAHRELSNKADERRHREQERQQARFRREQMVREAKENEQKQIWLSNYAKRFTDMLLTDGEFTVKPLISIDDFDAEAAKMHHCIATYYGKKDTLLLSIERDGIKCETAEINLCGRGCIVQCRGVCNQPSDYHDDIVEMLERFMGEFIRRYTMELKPQTNLPVLAKHYKTAI